MIRLCDTMLLLGFTIFVFDGILIVAMFFPS